MDITCMLSLYVHIKAIYVWNKFRFPFGHVNYRTKQFNLMASSLGSGKFFDTVVIPCITCNIVTFD